MLERKKVFLGLLIILSITLAGCGPSREDIQNTFDDIQKTLDSIGPKTYTVNKSTGLYNALDVDADMIAELSVGTKVKPAGDASSLSCTKVEDAGMTFNLCKVTVISTGQTGYVLRQWIE